MCAYVNMPYMHIYTHIDILVWSVSLKTAAKSLNENKQIRQCQQGWRLLQLFDIVPPVKTRRHTLLRSTWHNPNICRDPRGSSWLPHLADVVSMSAGISQSNGWALPKPIGQGTNWGLTKSSHVHSEGLTITPSLTTLVTVSARVLYQSPSAPNKGVVARTLRGLTATPPLPAYTKSIGARLMVGSYQAPTSTH